MIANKMESNGEKGRVMISEDTKNLVESSFGDEFVFEFGKEVEVAVANRKIKTYFVSKQ